MELLETNLSAVRQAAERTTDTLSAITSSLQSDTAVLKETGNALTDKAMRLSTELREQNALLRGASENACDILTRQTAAATAALTAQTEMIVKAGNDVYETLDEQSGRIKQDIRAQVALISDSGKEARDNISVITADLEEQTALLSEAAETARANTEKC